MQIQTVRVHEVQPILTHTQLQSGILKVTMRGIPVAVVFPGNRVDQVLTTLQSSHVVEQASLTLRQAQHAFTSYGKLLVPQLSERDCLITITSRQHAIGGIVSWKLWSLFMENGDTSWLSLDQESPKDRVLTVVAARNRLTDLPESFAREQVEQGSSEPIRVTRYGRHVFTIVPCHMSDSLLQLLLSGRRGRTTIQEESQKERAASGERSLPGGSGIAEAQLRHIMALTRNGYGFPVATGALEEGDSATLQACFWQQMLDLSDAQKQYQLVSIKPEGEGQEFPGFPLVRENIALFLRLVRLSAYTLQTARCLVELGENAEWRYLLAYYGKHEELDMARATKGLLAMQMLCQMDPLVQQEVQQGNFERVEVALVGLVQE